MRFSKLLAVGFFGLFFMAQKGSGQVVRGQILEAETRRPLAGASIFLIENGKPEAPAAEADSAGFFFIKAAKSGLFQLKVQQIGHETAFFPELELEVGKEKTLQIDLRSTTSELPEVEIRPVGNFEKLPSGQHLLSRDAVLKQPAVFADPARLATAFAGVAQPDDGTNGLSLRGLPPTMTRWQIEGLAVVSPNHLGNAGTVSDRPTTNSGGVTMLSAQILENSSLLVGPQPARFGGATGGILDLHLRNGNDRRREMTVSTGLIGLDAAIEGPFSMRKTGPRRASFLVNYRYSTVGLLQKLGVSFGDEAIDFQDFSAHLTFPSKNGRGETRVFSILGGSKNHFKNEKDSSAWAFEKDFFEIDFKSKTGILGIVHDVHFDSNRRFFKNLSAHFATALSAQTNSRRQVSRLDGSLAAFDTSAFSKADAQLWFLKKLGSRSAFSFGGQRENLFFRDPERVNDEFNFYSQSQTTEWAEFSSISGKLSFRTGFRIKQFGFAQVLRAGKKVRSSSTGTSELTASLGIQVVENQRVTFAFSNESMALPFIPDFLGADQIVLQTFNFSTQHEWRLAKKGLLKTTFFWLKMPEEPRLRPNWQQSIFDHIDWQFIARFDGIENGSATTKGIELTFQKFLEKGFFLLANATFFDAKRQTLADGEQPMRFNSRWISNLSFGKEWSKIKSENRSRSLGANLRATARGGFWDAPFGVLTGQKLPDYWRVDARLYWKKNLKKRTGTLALDIQNATNRKNVNYYFYDNFQQKTITKYGLGLIPILSYRLDFGL